MTTDKFRISALTWTLLILLGLIWGGSFFFARLAVAHVPPLTLVLLRVSLAALVLHLYLYARLGLYRRLIERWRAFLILGILNNAVPFTLIFAGQTEIGAGLAAILNATTPLWTVIIANRLTADEKLTTQKLSGCLLGLVGTFVLIGPDALAGLGAPVWAQLAVVGASISYGFAAIYGRRFSDIPPVVTATGQLTASTLVMLPLVLLVDRPWNLSFPPPDIALAIFLLAVVSTALAYILYFRIIATSGATNGSIVTLLVPPSAIVLGVLFLGERISPEMAVGLLLIVMGLMTIDGRILEIIKKSINFNRLNDR